MTDPFVIARRDGRECPPRPDKADRHGLITGATGTGKSTSPKTSSAANANMY